MLLRHIRWCWEKTFELSIQHHKYYDFTSRRAINHSPMTRWKKGCSLYVYKGAACALCLRRLTTLLCMKLHMHASPTFFRDTDQISRFVRYWAFSSGNGGWSWGLITSVALKTFDFLGIFTTGWCFRQGYVSSIGGWLCHISNTTLRECL